MTSSRDINLFMGRLKEVPQTFNPNKIAMNFQKKDRSFKRKYDRNK